LKKAQTETADEEKKSEKELAAAIKEVNARHIAPHLSSAIVTYTRKGELVKELTKDEEHVVVCTNVISNLEANKISAEEAADRAEAVADEIEAEKQAEEGEQPKKGEPQGEGEPKVIASDSDGEGIDLPHIDDSKSDGELMLQKPRADEVQKAALLATAERQAEEAEAKALKLVIRSIETMNAEDLQAAEDANVAAIVARGIVASLQTDEKAPKEVPTTRPASNDGVEHAHDHGDHKDMRVNVPEEFGAGKSETHCYTFEKSALKAEFKDGQDEDLFSQEKVLETSFDEKGAIISAKIVKLDFRINKDGSEITEGLITAPIQNPNDIIQTGHFSLKVKAEEKADADKEQKEDK
jgi:hypothetical protein